MTPFRKDRVSASALAMFVRCPEQYRLGYLQNRWEPRGPAGFMGSVAHRAIQSALVYQAGVGVTPPPGDLADIIDLAYKAELAEETRWDDTMTPGSARARAALAAHTYVTQVAPAIHLEAKPERWFELAVAGSPVPVVGKLDFIARVNTAELREPWADRRDVLGEWERCVVDVKTGRQAAKAVAPQWRIQGLIYACVSRLPVDYHTLTPYGEKGPVVRTPFTPTVTQRKPTKKEPDPERVVEYDCGELRVTLDESRYAGTLTLIRRLVAGIQAYYDRFGADEPWPSGAIAHQWACGLCSHQPECVYWNGEQAVNLEEWGLSPGPATTA